ncbi:MAG: tryptophan--tRNA ligase [Peptococcaceae bacterium]|jgi:tryptophanyl-tRNA synthetase|nr:tryptophan--tRNA ligase [Peptococcaceae bacterium]MDH7525926.1 tryptophan--tRNA ligase [Peptococcaceae bacterium]
MKKGVIFSGMRPTGRLHIGHLSVLENWVRLQEEYRCFFGIVDWHALTTSFESTAEIQDNIRTMLLDWLSVGLDPEKSPLFVQSQVKEHGELHLLFSMIIPLSWLERVPTYKDQIQQLGSQGKDISTYGFLGYPVLMAADILIYRADTVPVGEDQLAHVELCREIARRFNHLYGTDLFPEPQAKLARVSLLPGVDGRKMSKSYNNDIPLSASRDEILEKVQMMVTDPGRIKKTDPGKPEVCIVHTYQEIYNRGEVEEIRKACRAGETGCVACKKRLAAVLDDLLTPIRERRKYYESKPGMLREILLASAETARREAAKTLELARLAMNVSLKV